MESLLKRIERNRREHDRLIALILCLSLIVSMGTFAAFHKTAVAKTYTKDVLDCPYAMEDADPVAHVHNDDCYDGETLVCSLPELEAHTHSDECFVEQQKYICGLEENPGHQHGDGCYAAREVNICGLEENPGHEHTGACYNESGVLICTMEAGEGAHTHTSDCFTTEWDLVCEIPEGEGAHTHTEDCYTIERTLICNKTELPVHVHDAGCIRTIEWTEGEDEPAETGLPVNTAPEMPVSDPYADLETAEDWERDFENLELSGNWARDLVRVAATQQGHGESLNNFEAILNDAGDAWVRHGYTRYGAWYGYPYAEWSAMFVSFCLRYAGIPAENVPNNPTAAFMAESFSMGELFAGRDYVPAVGDLAFFDTVVDDEIVNIDHMGIVYYVDAENGIINTVEGDRADIVTTFAYHLDDEQIVGYGILPQNPYFVPAEGEVPDEEIGGFIVMTMDEEVTNEEEKTTDADKETADTDEETADTAEATMPAVPMPAQSWERTAGGIKVSVEAPEGAFPENTRIAVTPVNGNSLMDTVSDAVNGAVLEVQAVDITFFNEEGREIEPAAPIRVIMTPAESRHENEAARVIHIDDEQNAEVIAQAPDAETEGREIAFDADAFTIYAIAYVAVEFEYEVDGKVFTSTMPGAENMLLSEIVRGLGIVSEEKTDTFFSKIVSVASTNTEVAAVEATDSDWTVRVLKDGNAYINVTMQDSSVFSVKAEADGVTEISDENAVATVSTVNDLYLPANSEVKAEVLTEEQSGNAVSAVQTATEIDENSAATYQAFSIALENVDVSAYDGFNVAVTLPEDAVVGRDFQLYQVREDGTATDLTESLTVTSEQNEDGLQKVSGISFTTEDFADFVLSYSIETYYTTVSGDRYRITLNYGPKAEIPDGAELKVREILPEDETYGNFLDDSAAKLGVNSGDVTFARFFDIEIQKDDEKIEPKAPVQVTISLTDTPEETLPEGLKVVHFAQTGLETIDETQAEQKEDATIDLSFETNGFSVYGVVYTVDFEFEHNGTKYAFSIPGGGSVTLGQIAEALGLADGVEPAAEPVSESGEADSGEAVLTSDAPEEAASDASASVDLCTITVSEATREFLTSVVSVEFSDPSLVWVNRIAESTSVGQIKEDNDLEIQYSANLTEEQIVEINAQTVEAGDWALISLKAFDSEETLLITVEDGQQFVIRVTDAQIKKTVIDAKGDTWEITVTYGEDAQIPDGADLDVREILPKDDKYADYYRKAVAATNGIKLEEGDISIKIATEDNYARFFDIVILNGEEKIEPKAAVKVDIKLADTPETDDEWKVIHFDAAGPVVMESETILTDKADFVEMAFDTDGFSVYGVITTPAAPQGVNDLDGRPFTISRDGRYIVTSTGSIGNGGDGAEGFLKGNESNAAIWQFEQISGSTYYISTIVNGQKKYMHLAEHGSNRADASLSDDPQAFTVARDSTGYRLSATIDGRQYYLDEHNGQNGSGFAGYGGQSYNGILTFNFTQPIFNGNDSYMTLVKYGDKYYIVNNDATLTEIGYIEGTQEVYVENPMEWDVENGHLYYNNKEMGFDDRQLPSGFYRMYLDPSKSTPLTEENSGNIAVHKIGSYPVPNSNPPETYDDVRLDEDNGGRNEMLAATAVNIAQNAGKETYSISQNSKYLGVELEDGVPVRLTGKQSAENAAEFLFAKPKMNVSDWRQHTVNHIDISISGTANVNVPLAYGNYYGSNGDAEEPIMVVSDNTKLLLKEDNLVDPDQIKITTDDLKRVTITTARADNGVEVENAFYITGYSGNATSGYSDNQVRIEGAFLVADLRGTEYETVDASRYNNPLFQNYRNNVNTARKNHKIEYTVTVVKSLTYNLVDPVVGQLYDEAGEAITVTVDVAFSASFNYWDDPNANPKPSNGGNECPPLQPGNPYWNGGYDAWQDGEIWQIGAVGENGGSGMDFKLGGDAEDEKSPLVALEITKVIMDEAGNRIMLKTPVTNYFDIYENKNATNIEKNGVAGLHVVDSLNRPEWRADPRDATIHNDDYDLWRTKRVTVDESGSAIVFDYNATDAMYYIVERHDEESLPETVMDKAGNEFLYVKTYFETEYVRRDDTGSYDEYSDRSSHPQAMHLTEDFTRASPGEYAYASIPEVAGNFYQLDGKKKKEGFLEFYVYNIYRQIHDDISVHKQWQDSDGTNTDWLADVEFKLRKKTITVSGEGNAQTQTVTYSDVIRPDYMGSDWSDIIRVTSSVGEAKWEGLPVLEENESYVVIEYNIIGGEGTTVTDISRDEASSAITSFKLTKNGKTYTYDVTNGLLGDEGGTTINKQRKETDITLKKVDRDDLNRDDPALLKGASFTITKFDGANFQGKDTTWGTSGSKTVSDDKKQDGTYTLNGVFTFEGLSAGYYQIEETRFPDGYVKISGNPRFKVEEDASQQLVITLIDNPENLRLENNKLTIVVGNTRGVALPNTGGIGTTLFTSLGGLMTATAGAILTLVSFRRRRETVS